MLSNSPVRLGFHQAKKAQRTCSISLLFMLFVTLQTMKLTRRSMLFPTKALRTRKYSSSYLDKM